MKLKRVAIAAVAFSMPAAAQASSYSGNAYLTATVGIAKYKAEASAYYEDLANYLRKNYGLAASADNDDLDTAFNLGGGFQLTRHLAVEGFYRSYGELNTGVQASSMSGHGLMAGTRIKAYGPGIAVLGLLPVNDHLRYYLRLDAVSLKLEDETFYRDSLGHNAATSSTDTRITPGIGVGGRHDLGRDWALQMDMQFVRGKIGYANGTSDKVNINTLNIGVLKAF